MDRLVQPAPVRTDQVLCALAEVELALERRRRWRRRLVTATALASALCWVYAIRAYAWLSWSSPGFALLGGAAIALFLSERRLARQRCGIINSLPSDLRARFGP
jgi:hypothetical protein